MSTMGKIFDRLFPRIPESAPVPAEPRALSAPASWGLATVANPPTTEPTSALIRAISVLSALSLSTQIPSREQVLSIPAFRKAILLVTGIAGTLPYYAYSAANVRVDHGLLQQPERLSGLTRSVSLTKLAEDLYLDGSALCLVDAVGSTGFPTSVRRIPFNEWTQDENSGEIFIGATKQDPAKVRLFVAPFEGLLSVAGPTVYQINQLAALQAAYAANPQAREYLRGVEGLNLTDAQIVVLLNDWAAKRAAGITAYLPSDLELNQVEQMTPEQMTLTAAQTFEVEQVARLTGIDGFFLGVGTNAGMTYSNRVDIRQDLVDLVVGPALIRPIEERLSLDDMVPHGQQVRAAYDYFLRGNTLDRMRAFEIGSKCGAYDPQRISELEMLGRIIEPPAGGTT